MVGNIPTITVDRGVETPPTWAVLQRRLISLSNDALDPFLDRYLTEDGRPRWPADEAYAGIGGLDNLYEGVYNWPIFYLLGGSERAYTAADELFTAITAHVADIPTGLGHPQVVDEYQQGYDWFHQSEGNLLFYNLCLAAPTADRHRDRARRFADLYGRDELYDADRQLLRAPHLGSMGPASRNFSTALPEPRDHAHAESRIPWAYRPWKERYGLPFQDVPGVERVSDLREQAAAQRMGEVIRDRCARGDVVQNLAATTLVTNAYLLTGESRYREWVLEYVAAWEARADCNGGLVPDNVAMDGTIGGRLDGRWYGGWYGWSWPHGWHSIGGAVLSGVTNAMLLRDGADDALDLAREQLDTLLAVAIEVDGVPHLPYRHGDPGCYAYDAPADVVRDADGRVYWEDGWFEFKPQTDADAAYPTHLWYLSQREADRERCTRLAGSADDPVVQPRARKDRGGNEAAWLAYLAGRKQEYPTRVLEKDLAIVGKRIEFMRAEAQDPATYSEVYLQHRNPVTVEGLVHCTLGAPQQIYNGGLQFGRVRYFDPARERPGLPPGVAAVVTALGPDRTSLSLVNLAGPSQTVIVQAGMFGEHAFGRVSWTDLQYAFTERAYGYDMDRTEEPHAMTIDGRTVAVELAGASRVDLALETHRFVHQPSAIAPWDR